MLALVDAPSAGVVVRRRSLVDRCRRCRSTGWCRQEYIPSDVDEAEFDVSVTAPRGHEPRRDGRGDARGRERDPRRCPACASCSPTAGGGFLGSVNQGSVYVRIAPHEERTFSLGAAVARDARAASRWRAFRGNYTQRDVMQEVRAAAARSSRDLRVARAQRAVVQHRRRQLRHRLRRSAGPISRRSPSTPSSCAQRASELGGIVDADTTLKLDKPELRVEIDRDARRRSRRRHRRTSRTALRLMVGGDEESRASATRRQRGLRRRSCAWPTATATTPTTIARLYVPRQDGGLVRLDNLVHDRARPTAPSRIDRLDRQRQVSAARQRRARLRAGRPHRGAARGRGAR